MDKRFRVEVTLRKRKCHNCGDPITKGSKCLVHRYDGNHVRSNLCIPCLREITKEVKR